MDYAKVVMFQSGNELNTIASLEFLRAFRVKNPSEPFGVNVVTSPASISANAQMLLNLPQRMEYYFLYFGVDSVEAGEYIDACGLTEARIVLVAERDSLSLEAWQLANNGQLLNTSTKLVTCLADELPSGLADDSVISYCRGAIEEIIDGGPARHSLRRSLSRFLDSDQPSLELQEGLMEYISRLLNSGLHGESGSADVGRAGC